MAAWRTSEVGKRNPRGGDPRRTAPERNASAKARPQPVDTAGQPASEVDANRKLRLGYVPGATPGKWARIWQQRYPQIQLELIPIRPDSVAKELAEGRIDLAIARDARLSGGALDRETHHAIPLYVEDAVVIVPKDHLLAATDAQEPIVAADLSDEFVFVPADDVLYSAIDAVRTLPGRRLSAYRDDGTVDSAASAPQPVDAAEAVAWVANGAGLAVLPMSLARLHHRKDLTYRKLADGPPAPVCLAWPRDRQSQLIDDFIGVVRGRTPNSSRS